MDRGHYTSRETENYFSDMYIYNEDLRQLEALEFISLFSFVY